jgi:hypothetical protein
VFTSERTAEIEAASITSGEINSAGHLVLTRHDGTPIDMGAVSGVQLDGGTTYSKADVFSYVGDTDPGAVPDGSVWFDTTGPTGPFASTTQQGLVELATSAEAVTGTDTARAVTPAGVAAAIAAKVLAPNAITETSPATSYPNGYSVMSLTTGSGWSLNTGFGMVLTVKSETDRTVQFFYSNPGGTGTPRQWQRHYHSTNNGGGWTAWSTVHLTKAMVSTDVTQSSGIAVYPPGWSRIYFDNTTSAGWDFSGKWGELVNYFDGSGFGKQTFTEHGSSGSAAPNMWVRTGNTGGWSNWAKYLPDPGAWISYTPTWTTDSGLHLPSFGNATINCKYQKIGRTVNVKFSISFGSTTNFGSGATTSDNWVFSLPVTAADSTTDTIGWLDGYQSSTVNGLFRAKMSGTGAFKMNITAGSTASIGSDVDSLQPFTWASGNPLRGLLTYESAA